MERIDPKRPMASPSLRSREQDEDDGETSEDVTFRVEGKLDISVEDDAGSDPYNRTGTFERIGR